MSTTSTTSSRSSVSRSSDFGTTRRRRRASTCPRTRSWLRADLLERGAELRGNLDRLARRAVDEDVHEVAMRRRELAVAEDRDAVGDRPSAELVDAHARGERLWVR